MIRVDDITPSPNVADRRKKKMAETFREQQEEGESEPQPERGAPYTGTQLGRDLGEDDIDKLGPSKPA